MICSAGPMTRAWCCFLFVLEACSLQTSGVNIHDKMMCFDDCWVRIFAIVQYSDDEKVVSGGET